MEPNLPLSLKQIFSTALDVDPKNLAAFLTDACAGNAALEAEVRSLLEAHERPIRFLDPFAASPLSEAAKTSGPQALNRFHWLLVDEQPGTVIDRYKLIEVIGEGGHGTVFRAEQEQPVRRIVALKVIKKSADSDSVRARFEAERQTLALTDHSNIAKLFDAGTTESGRPYFVMELVPGVPITQFCDQQKFTVRRRVELYITVCRAIHHAHQKGIIHRDLKPSNILVALTDGAASPKVIDFGVSRMIAASGPAADDPQLLGTPQYMSPEQSSSDRGGVDIRSDVYALGAMLYELLAGVTAFDWTAQQVRTIQELRAVFDAQPAIPPSQRLGRLTDQIETQRIADHRRTGVKQLESSLRNDLDSIVLKAIARHRTDRYDSVAALAEDLQRHLDHRPVQASQGGALYLFGRFYRRNRTAVLLLTIIAVSLVVGLFVVSSLLVKTREARDQAVASEEGKVTLLRESYMKQANAQMLNHAQGRRIKTFEAIKLAARLNPSPELQLQLRNQAIACMSIPDVERISTLRIPGLRGCAIFSRNADRYAYVGADSQVHVVRCADGVQVAQFSLPDKPAITVRAFSPDGRYVEYEWQLHIPWLPRLFICDGFQTWDLETNRPVTQKRDWPPGEFNHRCDRWAAADSRSKTVSIYELPSGRRLNTFPTVGDIRDVHFSPDDDRLAIVSNEDLSVRIVQAESGAELTNIQTEYDIIYNLDWNPNGQSVTVTGGNQMDQIQDFDVRTGKVRLTLNGSQAATLGIAYSDDGCFLLTGGWDGRVRLWGVRRGDEILSFAGVGDGVGFVDARRFQIPEFSGAELWNLITSPECRSFSGSFNEGGGDCTMMSPDGKLLAEQNSIGIRIWNLDSQKPYAFVAAGGARSIAFSPDGTKLYASVSNQIRQWNMAEIAGRDDPHVGSFDSQKTVAMALSRDGHTMISGSDEGDLFVSDPTTGKRGKLTGTPVICRRFIAVSPDGKWAASSPRYEDHFEIWDLTDRKLVTTIPRGPLSGDIGPVAFSADGKTLFIVDGSAVRWLQVGTWKVTHLLDVNSNRAIDNTTGWFALSPDGRYIAMTTCGVVGTILANQTTGETLAIFDTPATPHGISTLGFSPDSSKLLVSGRGLVNVWDIPLVRQELRDMNLDWK